MYLLQIRVELEIEVIYIAPDNTDYGPVSSSVMP